MNVSFRFKNSSMRKIVLFLLTFCAVVLSCDKQVSQPVDYNITNDALQTGVKDIYLADNGTYDMQVLVKFLSGFSDAKIKLDLTGLPANVTVTPSTFTGVPTYTQDFKFTTTGAALGTYQLTLTASTSGQASKVYYFNINVIPANCATYFVGVLSGSSACASDYTYKVTGTASAASNVIYINNFGGYGPSVNAKVILDCVNRTLTVPVQTVGNGTTLQGNGSFGLDTMVINYTAVSTPGGPADNCTATLVR
jgi:hypothetical protein